MQAGHRSAIRLLRWARSPVRANQPLKRPAQLWSLRWTRASQVTGRRFASSLGRLQLGRRRLEDANSTIYALSTAPGRSAIAVIRISGSACVEIYHAVCPGKPLPKPRYAALRSLYQPGQRASTDSMLDPGVLVVYFPAPHTATGDDVLELHVHGGPAVVQAVLKAIAQCPTQSGEVRYAEAGEFTWRGFLNNRFDLTQVEALSGVLSADTEQQRKLSVRGTAGRLAQQYEIWRQQLLEARGELEALIDFQEDQHFDESPGKLAASVSRQVEHLRSGIKTHITNAVRGELLRNGISVALLGAPNAGKSSLLNLIVGREAAIVSREAGTTRDIVEVSVDINGYLCRFGDTAGLRNSSTAPQLISAGSGGSEIGIVEKEGIRRAIQRALESDVVLVLAAIDTSSGSPVCTLDAEVRETALACLARGSKLLLVINKVDLLSSGSDIIIKSFSSQLRAEFGDVPVAAISCDPAMDAVATIGSENGLQGLLAALTNILQEMTSAEVPSLEDTKNTIFKDASIWQDSLGASERHRLLLEDCLFQLESFLAQIPIDADGNILEDLADELDIVVAAENLRVAADCLSRITGRGGAGDVEEVLGVVFSKFCVGK